MVQYYGHSHMEYKGENKMLIKRLNDKIYPV